MNQVWVSGAIALLIVGIAGDAAAQSNGGGARTIWDGVYTEQQADYGEELATANCIACHSAAEWSNARFLMTWNNRPIAELHDQLRATMPFEAPGRLSPEEYSAIVAYILKLNDAPAGSAELPSGQDGLAAINVTRPDRR